MEMLKVSSKSNPNSVAGALANVFREKGSVEIQAIGVTGDNESKELEKELYGVIEMAIKSARADVFKDKKSLENEVRNLSRKFLFKKLKKYPAILMHIYTA